jgi:LacI family transcriptional regulator
MARRGRKSSAGRRIVLALLWWSDERLLRGISRYAQQADWILDASGRHRRRLPFGLTPHGLITLASIDRKRVSYVRSFKVPTVAFGVHGEKFGTMRVMGDEEAIGPTAVEHFINCSLEHIGFVEYWGTGLEYRRRLILQEAVTRSGLTFHLLDGNSLEKHLRNLPKPVGLMASNDEVMMKVMEVCLKEGYRIPEEIALLGVDDIEFICETAPVPLSSINLNFERMGYEAAAWLDRLMSGEAPPRHPVVVPLHGLTARKSTDLLAFRNERLVKATRYIREHFQEPITAADVVRFSGVSRQVLQKLFRRDIGRSILNVIMRSRVDEAKRMLLKTDCKLDIVSERCGFGNRLHFHRTFSRLAGRPPARWRREHRA